MADIKPGLEGVDANAADREPAIELSGATPAETPSPGTPNKNGTTMELEKTQLTQADLMATRPNGGWKAWLQVACGFSLMFNTYGAITTAFYLHSPSSRLTKTSIGLINTFGIYQDYYTDHLRFSPSRASLIGGLQTFLLFFATAFAGPLYDAGYTRLLVAAGAVLIVFGTMMQSLCSEYWQFILAESLLIGFGGGLTSFLSPTVLSTYFTTLYPLAQGIAASGAGIGG